MVLGSTGKILGKSLLGHRSAKNPNTDNLEYRSISKTFGVFYDSDKEINSKTFGVFYNPDKGIEYAVRIHFEGKEFLYRREINDCYQFASNNKDDDILITTDNTKHFVRSLKENEKEIFFYLFGKGIDIYGQPVSRIEENGKIERFYGHRFPNAKKQPLKSVEENGNIERFSHKTIPGTNRQYVESILKNGKEIFFHPTTFPGTNKQPINFILDHATRRYTKYFSTLDDNGEQPIAGEEVH